MGQAVLGESQRSKAANPGAKVKLPRPFELYAQPQGAQTNIPRP